MARTLDEMREAATEQALIRRARSGDRGAFDALVRSHFTHVYAFLHRMIRSHEDAEDLAQECFVRAWRSLPHYREQSAFSTWLLRIARHLAHDHHRAGGRRPRIAPFEQAGEQAKAHAQPGSSPADALQRREVVREIADALQRLPERLRAAIVLRTIEGREYDEVAEILGVKPATARMLVMQARRALAQRLRREGAP
jgi:RNA polymerase sigma-70 factor (ECF subfamily)